MRNVGKLLVLFVLFGSCFKGYANGPQNDIRTFHRQLERYYTKKYEFYEAHYFSSRYQESETRRSQVCNFLRDLVYYTKKRSGYKGNPNLKNAYAQNLDSLLFLFETKYRAIDSLKNYKEESVYYLKLYHSALTTVEEETLYYEQRIKQREEEYLAEHELVGLKLYASDYSDVVEKITQLRKDYRTMNESVLALQKSFDACTKALGSNAAIEPVVAKLNKSFDTLSLRFDSLLEKQTQLETEECRIVLKKSIKSFRKDMLLPTQQLLERLTKNPSYKNLSLGRTDIRYIRLDYEKALEDYLEQTNGIKAKEIELMGKLIWAESS